MSEKINCIAFAQDEEKLIFLKAGARSVVSASYHEAKKSKEFKMVYFARVEKKQFCKVDQAKKPAKRKPKAPKLEKQEAPKE